jgi:opacity protein-like surface antigen
MKIKLLFLSLVTTLLLCCSRSQAQIAPYAMFSLGHYSGLGVGPGTSPTQSGGITSLGGTVGVNMDSFHAGPIAAGLDVRGMIQNSANSTPYGNKLAGFLIGPRLTANTLVLPFRPYVQAEVGVVGTNNGTQTNKDAHFAYQIQLGGDFTILPHLAARVEYGFGQLTGTSSGTTGGTNSHTLQTLGAGLVFRL